MTEPTSLFADVIRGWDIQDDGDATVTFAFTPEDMGRIGQYVADPDYDVVLGIVAVPRAPEAPETGGVVSTSHADAPQADEAPRGSDARTTPPTRPGPG